MWEEMWKLNKGRTSRYFRTNRAAKLITIACFFIVLGSLATGIYAFFLASFRYISYDAFFREALLLYIIELFLLVSFVLVFASALIAGIAGLFRGKDDLLLMASPKYMLKPSILFLRMFLSSLWPLLVVILPAFIALLQTVPFVPIGIFYSLLSFVLLIALAVLAAIVLLLLIALMLYVLGRGRVPLLSTGVVTLCTVLAFLGMLAGVWARFHSVNLVQFFQARVLTTTAPDIAPILHQFEIFPSHFAALSIFFGIGTGVHESLTYPLLLAGLVVIAALLYFLLREHYLPMWQIAQEGHASVAKHSNVLSVRMHMLSTANGGKVAIFYKELIIFFRDARGMLWFGFIILIWSFQSASSFMLAHGLDGERVSGSALPKFVGLFAFAGIVYFVAMFVLRFAFPSFSSERKTGWVTLSSPVDLGATFLPKLAFFSTFFVMLAVIFSMLNASVVTLSASGIAVFLAALIVATITLTTYGLALGAIFPNTETDDPEALSTTLPGLGFIGGTLLYGGLGAVAVQQTLLSHSVIPFDVFVVFSMFVLYFLIRAAQRSLTRVEL